ncbi:MAG: Diaminohydroxyphosphoribosylaminopyrimidine deaminase / 5-amino-6-(5-phosphoribosylamino)uracil reductase, partial [uncultured Craurococcus sp.]
DGSGAYGGSPGARAAGARQYLAQPGGRLRSGEGRPGDRPRLDPARWPPPCRDAGARPRRRLRPRRHRLCHPRALLPLGPHAAVLRRAGPRRRHPRGRRHRRPGPARRRPRPAAPARGRRHRRARPDGRGGPPPECRLRPAHHPRPAPRHPQAGDDARRPHRHLDGGEPVDHRPCRPPRGACAARPARRHPGRQRHRPCRRPGAHRPPPRHCPRAAGPGGGRQPPPDPALLPPGADGPRSADLDRDAHQPAPRRPRPLPGGRGADPPHPPRQARPRPRSPAGRDGAAGHHAGAGRGRGRAGGRAAARRLRQPAGLVPCPRHHGRRRTARRPALAGCSAFRHAQVPEGCKPLPGRGLADRVRGVRAMFTGIV